MVHQPLIPWAKINDFLQQVGTARTVSDLDRLVSTHVADLIPHDFPILTFHVDIRAGGSTSGEEEHEDRPAVKDSEVLATAGDSDTLKEFNEHYRLCIPFEHGYFRSEPETDFRPLEHTEFVTDFVRPRRIKRMMGVWFRPYSFAISRCSPARPFTDVEKAMLEIIGPHLEHYYGMLRQSRNEFRAEQNTKFRPKSIYEMLTQREVEIVSLVARGLTNQEIATELSVSADTVKRHIYNVFQKLRVTNRVQLATRVVSERQ